MKRISIESLELRNISFGYDEESRIFKDFSHRFEVDDLLYLQGPRGSGKNTLMKLLLGLLVPLEGKYLINGVCVNELSHKQFDSYRLNIGHSFDVGGLINNHTLYENFRILLDYHAFLEPAKRFDYIVDLMKQFGLENHKHLRPAFVSSSARKAACVLRAFALKPEVVILDNPTQGMSTEQVPALVELITQHRQQFNLKHVIISSDDIGLIKQLEGREVRVTSVCLFDETGIRKAS